MAVGLISHNQHVTTPIPEISDVTTVVPETISTSTSNVTMIMTTTNKDVDNILSWSQRVSQLCQ